MNKEQKRGIIFVIIAVLIFIGMIYSSVFGKKNENNEKIQVSVLQTKPPDGFGNTDQTASPTGAEQIETTAQPEERVEETEVPELEEMSADIDISSIPDEVVGMLNISKADLKERIKVYANGQGFASETKVYYYGEYSVDNSAGTVSVPMYFAPEGSGSDAFSFNLIYYRESKNLVMEPW